MEDLWKMMVMDLDNVYKHVSVTGKYQDECDVQVRQLMYQTEGGETFGTNNTIGPAFSMFSSWSHCAR